MAQLNIWSSYLKSRTEVWIEGSAPHNPFVSLGLTQSALRIMTDSLSGRWTDLCLLRDRGARG